MRKHRLKGFTLIELSIILVIIGLIVGGVLVGRDLISAAGIRSQISQIEKYHTAVNSFRGKYNYLPGDIPDPDATNFGFKPRGATRGQGNGDGQIECAWNGAANTPRMCIVTGEAGLFWADLSSARLVDGNFPHAVCCSTCSGPQACSPLPATFAPSAKLGSNNYIFVYSDLTGAGYANINANFFGIENIRGAINSAGDLIDTPAMPLTVYQANAIDAKMDDGLPQAGKIIAKFPGGNSMYWSSGLSSSGSYGTADTSATAASSTTCFDNSNVGGATQKYSITQNNGAGVNCALSFKFQ